MSVGNVFVTSLKIIEVTFFLWHKSKHDKEQDLLQYSKDRFYNFFEEFFISFRRFFGKNTRLLALHELKLHKLLA